MTAPRLARDAVVRPAIIDKDVVGIDFICGHRPSAC